MSSPRAATSVATSTLNLPARKPARVTCRVSGRVGMGWLVGESGGWHCRGWMALSSRRRRSGPQPPGGRHAPPWPLPLPRAGLPAGLAPPPPPPPPPPPHLALVLRDVAVQRARAGALAQRAGQLVGVVLGLGENDGAAAHACTNTHGEQCCEGSEASREDAEVFTSERRSWLAGAAVLRPSDGCLRALPSAASVCPPLAARSSP